MNKNLEIYVDEEPEEFDMPKYSDVGMAIIEIENIDRSENPIYRYSVVCHYNDGCTWLIGEGMGFQYWVNSCLEFEREGFFVIEDIVGYYYRGDWSWGEDDDEEFIPGIIRCADAEDLKLINVDIETISEDYFPIWGLQLE